MQRITLLTNRVDKHGDLFLDNTIHAALRDMNGERKMVWTMNHRRELPPLGRIINGQIEQDRDLLVLTGETQKYHQRKDIDWDPSLVMETFDTPSPLLAVIEEPLTEPRISIDFNNFPSEGCYDRYCENVRQLNAEFGIETHARKSDIPDPELIISLAQTGIHGWLLAYLLKPIAEKVAEKVTDDVYEAGKKQLKNFRDYVVRLMKLSRGEMLPKNRVMTTVFDMPGSPHIKLIAKTDDPSLVAAGLNEKRLQIVREEIEKFRQHFAVAKIQFILSKTGRWKFNYLLTDKGEVIGHKLAFKERDKQFQRLTMPNLYEQRMSLSHREAERIRAKRPSK